MTASELVEVTQADRERAVDAALKSSLISKAWSYNVKAGEMDGDPFVQAFARHRQAAVAEAVEAERERCAKVADAFALHKRNNPSDANVHLLTATDIATAIRQDLSKEGGR